MNFPQILERFRSFIFATQCALTKAATFPTNGVLNAGTTVIAVAEFDTDGYSRITGTARSDVALSLHVYQGSATTKNYVTTVAIPAAAGEGAGAAFSVEIISGKARIDIQNAGGGASSTLAFDAYMRSV